MSSTVLKDKPMTSAVRNDKLMTSTVLKGKLRTSLVLKGQLMTCAVLKGKLMTSAGLTGKLKTRAAQAQSSKVHVKHIPQGNLFCNQAQPTKDNFNFGLQIYSTFYSQLSPVPKMDLFKKHFLLSQEYITII